MTSAVAYSSAMRTGSGRSEIRVPRLRMRARWVCRARMPRIRGFAPKSELIPAWCSMATTFRPTSSHSWNSSRTCSKRSAAILGSQYLLGRLARTESARSRISWGTNGYTFSLWNHTSMAPLLGSPLLAQKLDHPFGEGLGLLDLGMVPGRLDQLEARPGNEGTVRLPVSGRHDAVARPPQHQRGDGDPPEPALELGVVHVGMPGVETERFPVARPHDDLVVGHGVVVGRPPGGIMPAPPRHFHWRGVEHVADVRGLAIADLDPQRVDEDQPVQTVTTLHRDLRGQPASEGEPHQRHLLVRESVDDVEAEMDEVVHRLELRRTGRVAEARVRRGDDLGVPAEEVEIRSPGIDILEAMQEQQRAPRPAPHDLELDARHRPPLSRGFEPGGHEWRDVNAGGGSSALHVNADGGSSAAWASEFTASRTPLSCAFYRSQRGDATRVGADISSPDVGADISSPAQRPPVRAERPALPADAEGFGIIRRRELGPGRVALAGDLHLPAAALHEGVADAVGVRHVAQTHGAAEGVAVGARGDPADQLAVAPDGLVVIEKRVRLGQHEDDQPTGAGTLALGQERLAPVEGDRLVPANRERQAGLEGRVV